MSRPQRLPGFAYRGPYRYFLTFCTHERRPTFRDPAVVALVRLQFLRTARLTRFAILAFCVMPDHAHLLVEGRTEQSDLRRFVKHFKQGSGQRCTARVGGRLWQDGCYERVLRPGDDAKAFARYIIENPVRAGLARTPREYPHLGSSVWSVDELIDSVR
ncbi:MAG: transposase [Acidimicrobiia bacterium]|nr:transposase [Acidimicrobiia bacterium]